MGSFLYRYRFHLLVVLVLILSLIASRLVSKVQVTPEAHDLPISRYLLQAPGGMEPRAFILHSVREALPKSHKHQAFEVAKTIIKESNRYKFDPLLIMAMARTESSFNPKTRGYH